MVATGVSSVSSEGAKDSLVSGNQDLRRSVLNQLESLHLAGVTHASVENFRGEKISAEKTLNANVKEPKVTMVNPVKDLTDKTNQEGETRNSAQPGGRDASPGVVHAESHEASNTTRNIKIEASLRKIIYSKLCIFILHTSFSYIAFNSMPEYILLRYTYW